MMFIMSRSLPKDPPDVKKSALLLLLGFVLGLVLLYVVGLLSSVLALFGPPERLLAALAISLIAGGSIFFAWRWDTVALWAGVAVLVLALIGAVTTVSGPATASLSVPDVLAHGTTNPLAFVMGTVMVCCSIASRLPRHRH
jgi:hypothetical protein